MQKKQKVVLFLPKARKHTFHGTLPVALLKLASMVDRKKFDLDLIIAKPNVDYEKQVVEASKGAMCVCLSVLTGNDITNALTITKKIRVVSKATVVWGGWHASIFPEQTLENQYVDIVIRGQGERTFQKLIERLAEKKSLKGLLGVSYKEGGKIKRNEDRPFEDINNFPPISYNLVNLEDYISTFNGMRGMVSFTSQGCPFNCKFCAEPLVYKQQYSALSNDRILDEWEFFVKEHNIKFVGITDDNFFVNEAKIIDFCQKLLKRKLGVKWGKACGRVRQMLAFKDSTWQLIADAGCMDIEIGDESGIQSTLDFINKQLSVEEIVEFTNKCRKYGFEVMHNWLYGIPLPQFKTMNKKEINAWIWKEWLAMFDVMDKCHHKYKDYDEVRVCPYYPYPGNPLFDLSCELGFKPPTKLENWANLKPAIWLDDSWNDKRRMLLHFIFPYASDFYAERHMKKFRLVQRFFHETAKFRWKYRYFGFPLDYRLYEFYTNFRMKITGVSATEHD